MRHTFQLAFVNHHNVKRKYMFSMTEAENRTQWLAALHAGVERVGVTVKRATTNRTGAIASAVSLQVLRDALISPDDSGGVGSSQGAASAPRRPGTASGRGVAGHARSNSFSRTYPAGLGRGEADLNPADSRQPSRNGPDRRPSSAGFQGSVSMARRGSKDSVAEALHQAGSLTGHAIVLTACQNSHLPSVLALLNAHVHKAPHPLSAAGSAFRPHLPVQAH